MIITTGNRSPNALLPNQQFLDDVHAAKEILNERAFGQFATGDMQLLANDLRDLANKHVPPLSSVGMYMRNAADRLQNFDLNNYDKGGEDLQYIVSELQNGSRVENDEELKDYLDTLALELQEDGNFFHTGPLGDAKFPNYGKDLMDLRNHYDRTSEDDIIEPTDGKDLSTALTVVAEYLPEDDSEVRQNLMKAASLLKNIKDSKGWYANADLKREVIDLLSKAMGRTQRELHETLRDMQKQLDRSDFIKAG